MKLMNIKKYLNTLKALTHSVVSKINRLTRSDKNESLVIYTRFRLGNLLRAVRSASNKIYRNIRLSNNSDKTNTDFFQSRFNTVLWQNDGKYFYTKNEYIFQDESRLFFHSF